jgi:hypothetical protein
LFPGSWGYELTFLLSLITQPPKGFLQRRFVAVIGAKTAGNQYKKEYPKNHGE